MEAVELNLRRLCGYVEDGSAREVTIGQDDATHDWFVTVGKKNYFGSSMGEALANAVKGERDETASR